MINRHPGSRLFAFHRLVLALPPSWNPTRIEGDFDKGQILIADLDHPRLGLRWQKIGSKRVDPAAWARRNMRQEVGQLAAAEATDGPVGLGFGGARLYLEPKPPGRDVWIGYSPASARAIQLVYHARRRDRILAETILPSLADTLPNEPAMWSIFDLRCSTPPGFALKSHRLLAGDLSMTFTRQRDWMTLRQIGVAQLALSRRPINQWLADQQKQLLPHYRPNGNLRETTIAIGGRELSGFARDALRLRRFGWKYWVPRNVVTTVMHDPEADRLLLFQGSDARLIEALAATI